MRELIGFPTELRSAMNDESRADDQPQQQEDDGFKSAPFGRLTPASLIEHLPHGVLLIVDCRQWHTSRRGAGYALAEDGVLRPSKLYAEPRTTP